TVTLSVSISISGSPLTTSLPGGCSQRSSRPLSCAIPSAGMITSVGTLSPRPARPRRGRSRPPRPPARGAARGSGSTASRAPAAAAVGVDQGGRGAADRERAVVAGAVAVDRVQDVGVRGVARAQHAVGEVVGMRAAALARDRVDPLDVLGAELVEALRDERDAV